MRKILLIHLLGLIVASSLLAQTQEKYSRVKIDMVGRQPFTLARLGLDVEHGNWQPNRHFIGEFSAHELAIIRRAGFSYEVIVDDVVANLADQNRLFNQNILRGVCGEGPHPYKTPRNYRYGKMGGFFTYSELLAILDSMRLLYPHLISVKKPISETLKTHQGRPVYWIRVSDNPDVDETEEPEVFYNALHHAREPASLSQMIFYLWYLLENYATDPEAKFLLNNTALYFVPCVNPDGYIHNESLATNGGGLWRKNQRKNADGTVGVDLNRNYGFKWGHSDNGSSPVTSSETYRGTAAFSEPETELLRRFTNSRRFQMAMNYHTFGNLLIYPWAYNDTETPDAPIFRGLTEVLSRDNGYKGGTGIQTVGYNVNGNVDDWMYGEQTAKGKIFTLTPEVGSYVYGFWPPQSAIIELNRLSMSMNLNTAHFVHNFGLATDKTPQYVKAKTGNFNYELKRYGLKTGILQVSLRSGSPNLTIEANNSRDFSLAQMATATGNFAYTLSDSIKNGDDIVFLLSVNNGQWTRTDTLRKVFGTPNQPFVQEEASLRGFNTTAWGITDKQYFSRTTSLYTGIYNNNVNSTITTLSPILIPEDAVKAVLRYRTWWRIEPLNDYVTPSIQVNNGVFQPICGKLTRTHPTLNIPIYDGDQTRWLEEELDLMPFKGKSVNWRLTFKTNNDITYEGFHFDDMVLDIFTPSGGGRTGGVDKKVFVLSQNYPNPATNWTTIELGSEVAKWQSPQLVVTDVLGRIVFKKMVSLKDDPKIRLTTEGWASGVYFYFLETEKGVMQSKTQRLVVGH
jgi:carboxypeptidase T